MLKTYELVELQNYICKFETYFFTIQILVFKNNFFNQFVLNLWKVKLIRKLVFVFVDKYILEGNHKILITNKRIYQRY